MEEEAEQGSYGRRIKTYVLRQAKITKAQARAFETSGDRWIVPYEKRELDVHGLFGNANPVVLEIGFGMGHATAEIADSHSELNFLAVEVHKPGVGALIERIEAKGLTNIRIVHHDVADVLEHMLPQNCLHGVHIFFPDPWPKKKHHKRRLIQVGFLESLYKVCTSRAYLYLVTDWEDYARYMLDVIGKSPHWHNESNGFTEPLAWRPQTAFERKGKSKAHVIREIYALRNS